MKFNYVGQDVEVTDAIKGYIEKKFQKIKRPLKELQEEEIEVHVGLRKERAEYRVDVDVYINQTGEKIHVWDADKDLYAAIDKVVDELEKKLMKDKAKEYTLIREARKEKEQMKAVPDLPPERRERPRVEEEELVIDKPMDVEDAIFELEDKHLHFLPFVDIATGELRILYKKKAGNYGVIRTGCKVS
jgi:putative sigma-54 modulation protein